MAREIIKCPKCEYSASYVEMGKRGKLNENLVDKARMCQHAGNYERAKACPEFASAVKASLGVTL